MALDAVHFSSVIAGVEALQEFLYDREEALPDDVRVELRRLSGPTTSPVDAVVKAAELIYARRADLQPKALALGAALAVLAESYNFHGLATDNRGTRMALSLMRDADVTKPVLIEYPDVTEDPDPIEGYAPAVTPIVADAPPVEETPPAAGARRGRGQRDPKANNTK